MFLNDIKKVIYYYFGWMILFLFLTLAFEPPAHAPGLNILSIGIMLLVSMFIILFNGLAIITLPEEKLNVGAFFIHLLIVGSLIAWWMVGYYSQFQAE